MSGWYKCEMCGMEMPIMGEHFPVGQSWSCNGPYDDCVSPPDTEKEALKKRLAEVETERDEARKDRDRSLVLLARKEEERQHTIKRQEDAFTRLESVLVERDEAWVHLAAERTAHAETRAALEKARAVIAEIETLRLVIEVRSIADTVSGVEMLVEARQVAAPKAENKEQLSEGRGYVGGRRPKKEE